MYCVVDTDWLFCIGLVLKSDFAAQASVESDCYMFIKYTSSMFSNIFVFHTECFAAHGHSESDVCISLKYDL